MDGVSIAASLLAISGAGCQIAIKLYTLATQISTASERISSISNDVSLTSGVLQQLGELMTTKATHDGTTIFSQGGLDTTRKSAAMCENIFNDIDQAAKDASQQIRARRKLAGGKITLTNSEKLNHQTASTNIVEQREIIDAILAIQKQQNDIESSRPKRLLVMSSSCYTPATATQDNLDEQSTLAQNRLPNTTPALSIRPHVLAAMPPPSPPVTRTKPGSDHTSLPVGVVLTSSESTLSDESEGSKTLEFFLMKPTIKDLGDVIQLSWKIHKLRMQQAEILNHINNNEQEGLPPVHEIYQALYTYEHVALEDEISRAGAGSYVSLRSMKRIHMDLTHREILFKGIPGLQFVLECIIRRPPVSKSPQASLFMPAQSAASGQLRSNGSGESKKTTSDDTINATSNPSSPFGVWYANWKRALAPPAMSPEVSQTPWPGSLAPPKHEPANKLDANCHETERSGITSPRLYTSERTALDQHDLRINQHIGLLSKKEEPLSSFETGRTLRRKPKMVIPSTVATSVNDSGTWNQAHKDGAGFHTAPTGTPYRQRRDRYARKKSRNDVRPVNPQIIAECPPAKRARPHHRKHSARSTQNPVMQGMSLNNQGNTGAKIDYSENYDDSEDQEEMSGQGMDDKEAERIVEELLGKYTTLFEGSGRGEMGSAILPTPKGVLC
ncbi:MAG: hypothetical protein Q9178_001477 [Gyalolechia marmorata]